MNGDAGYPKAPPLSPQSPRRRRFGPLLWTVAIVLSLAAVVGIPLAGFILYAGHDRLDFIDRPDVVDALAPACDELAAAVANLPPGPTDANSLSALSVSAHAIPAAVADLSAEQVDDDFPVEDWGADWIGLLDLVDRYVVALEAGRTATFMIPRTSDDFSIVGRMDYAAPDSGCRVPAAFIALDPDPPPLPPEVIEDSPLG